jgi:hypothetical protein
MTQMSSKAGIRKHGKAAEDALIAKFRRMEDLNVYEPIAPGTLRTEQKKPLTCLKKNTAADSNDKQ